MAHSGSPLVFISHSHKDTDFAHAVNGVLQDGGYRTFLDAVGLHVGDEFRSKLRAALDESSALVVICSKYSMRSSEVLFEVAYCMGRNVPVLPLQCTTDAVLPPFMKVTHYLDFRRGARPWDALIDGLLRKTDGHNVLSKRVRGVGLIDIGRSRSQQDRLDFIKDIVEHSAPYSRLVITGRSLADWSSFWVEIEEAIRAKHLQVKIAMLDPDAIRRRDDGTVDSWVEKPIPDDWAAGDVSTSVERFRRITVIPDTGSLSIYGLPFFLPQSFVAYSDDRDGKRCCFQEVGIATEREGRPYVLLAADDRESYGGVVERIHEEMLTSDRLKIFRDGAKSEEHHFVHNGKFLANKVQGLGLVDLAPTRAEREWFRGDVLALIEDTADKGEILIVGRSLVAWTNHYNELVKAIVDRGVRCRFVIADPTIKGLRSLVRPDYAERDVRVCWKHFQSMAQDIEAARSSRCGSFELYGVPAYVPTTFAAYSRRDGTKFCTLEAGIGVGPGARPSFFFQRVSDNDIYSGLYGIFVRIADRRALLLEAPGRVRRRVRR